MCVCVDNTTSVEKPERNATVSSSSILERKEEKNRKKLAHGERHTHTDKQVNIDRIMIKKKKKKKRKETGFSSSFLVSGITRCITTAVC